MGLTGSESDAFDYVELLRRLEAAQESDAIEQALAAARERLNMDAAYLTTIDDRHETVDAVLAEPEIAERYQDAVLPLEQTYCMRMLSGSATRRGPGWARTSFASCRSWPASSRRGSSGPAAIWPA